MGLRRLLRTAMLIIASGIAGVQAQPWSTMTIVGQADLKFLFWPVYDAKLFSETNTFLFPETRPYALSLTYKRDFRGRDLVQETTRQWQKMGIPVEQSWLEQLGGLLPDVEQGDEITLYVDRNAASTFYFNGEKLGLINDPLFSREFSAIWLSEKTTRPELRQALLTGTGDDV